MGGAVDGRWTRLCLVCLTCNAMMVGCGTLWVILLIRLFYRFFSFGRLLQRWHLSAILSWQRGARDLNPGWIWAFTEGKSLGHVFAS